MIIAFFSHVVPPFFQSVQIISLTVNSDLPHGRQDAGDAQYEYGEGSHERILHGDILGKGNVVLCGRAIDFLPDRHS